MLAAGWFAYPATRIGVELIGAGLLIIAGPIDGDEFPAGLPKGKSRARTCWTANDFRLDAR
jgi:hypothetical protein